MEMGHVFCGESMFSKVSNASKAGFIQFVEKNADRYKTHRLSGLYRAFRKPWSEGNR